MRKRLLKAVDLAVPGLLVVSVSADWLLGHSGGGTGLSGYCDIYGDTAASFFMPDKGNYAGWNDGRDLGTGLWIMEDYVESYGYSSTCAKTWYEFLDSAGYSLMSNRDTLHTTIYSVTSNL